MDEPMTRARYNGEVLELVRKTAPETQWRADGNDAVFSFERGGERRLGILVFKNAESEAPVDLILSVGDPSPENDPQAPPRETVDKALLDGPAAVAKKIAHFFTR